MSLRARLKHVYPVGDRVLIRPMEPEEQSASGLYLPPSVHEKEKTALGYVVRVGPGYLIPHPEDESEFWKPSSSRQYIPLEAQVGDLVVYLQKHAIDVRINDENYVVVPHHAILLIVRK